MKSIAEIGLKIAPNTREYFRYNGESAELECRGAGSSRPELAWARRQRQREDQGHSGAKDKSIKADWTDYADDPGIKGQNSPLQHP